MRLFHQPMVVLMLSDPVITVQKHVYRPSAGTKDKITNRRQTLVKSFVSFKLPRTYHQERLKTACHHPNFFSVLLKINCLKLVFKATQQFQRM